ncbi:MAG: hypothetical protein ACYCVB_02590, partial [Bacilli bacterium]
MKSNRRLKRQLRVLNEAIGDLSITEKSDKDVWDILYIHFNTHEYTEERLRSILSACNWAIPMNETGNLTLVMIVFVTGTLTYLTHYLAGRNVWIYMDLLGGMVA